MVVRQVILVLAVLLAVSLPVGAGSESRPNIVFIMIDDLGWTDVGCYGNDFAETPNIDRLASEGVRFTDFYAAGAVCSPTRASIQAGRNQARFGLTDFIPGHWRPFEKVVTPQTALRLPSRVETVAERLRAAGYTTGYFGKWHLSWRGSPKPQEEGYDTVVLKGGRHFGFGVRGTDPPKPADDAYLTEYLTDRTVEFIEGHADEPFFAFLSHYAVHIPLQAPRPLVEKYRKKEAPAEGVNNPVYAAMLEAVDRSVGRILAKLDALDLAKETMVVFTSDNGGLYKRYGPGGEAVTSNAPLRGQKGSLYEGGIRVPLIVRWPGHAAEGEVSDAVTISHDLYPTFVSAAGGSLPEEQPIDGRSLLPVLRDPDASLERNAIYFHYPHYHHSRPATAVRSGRWKLIEFLDDGSVELYNLEADIGEEKNLAEDRPALVRKLRSRLDAWRGEVRAAMPRRNPAFDADRRMEWWNRRRIKPIDMEAFEKRWDRIPVYPGADG